MLGLANAISGTATIVDRKYSAYFDGTGDYIDTGDTFQATLRADFSWSLWVKPDDGQPGSDMDILGAENSSGEDKIYIRLATTGKIWLIHESNNDDATYQTANAVFPNGACDWTHIAVRVQYTDGGADTSYNIYVNGYAVNGTLTDAVAHGDHAAYTSDINFFIGGRNNNGSVANAFAGYIDEVALFRSHLSGAEIAAIYNSGRPFDLINDLGDYDQASNLKAYYKMFDGLFDDRVNGIVHDNGISSGAPGYGSQLWDGTDGDDANWVTYNNNTKAEVSGAVEITYVDHGFGAYHYFRDTKDLNTDLTVGATYKITFQTKVNTGSANWQVNSQESSGAVTYLSEAITSTDFVTVAIYFVATNATTAFIRGFNMGTGEKLYIKNISLKKLNGFPGITSGNTTFNTSTPHTQAMSSVATFDGTGDYLDVGNAYQSIIRNSFTWSFWMKPNDGQPATQQSLLGSHKTGDTDYFRIDLHTDGKIKAHHAANSSGIAQTTDSAVYANNGDQWKHICVTVTENTSGNTSHVIYVNGSVEASTASATLSDTNHNLYAGVDHFYIGGMNKDGTLTYPYNGYIDEVALWNVVLDADAVSAIHTAGKSYNLTADTGNYDNSSSLQGYWRMGGGNGDVVEKGFIADQTNVGFGSEIVANGGFDSDLTSWSTNGTDSSNTISQADGKVVLTADGSTALQLFQASVFTTGSVYKVEFDAYDITGAGLKIQSGANENIGPILADGHYVFYHRANGANLNIYRRTGSSASSGKLDNISVKQVNGNSATTVANATFIRQPV
tara:strand:+ start:592 stop:2946 length:2355 start_codon:yes stop_codon:yes gene_type:complete